MAWGFALPTAVYFGRGEVQRLPQLIAGRRAALVHARSAGVPPGEYVGRFSGIRPNPTQQNAADCAAFLRSVQAEVVVALGGGSVMDCAKAAAHGLPLIAVPTTAGTGSEVTNISVLSDDVTHQKVPLADPAHYPEAAVVDPLLTRTMPPKLTAESGMDALSHALEAQWSIHHNPASDALAQRAVELLFTWLESAFREPENLDARSAVSEASLLAGMAFSQAKTAGVHACSFPLTARYGLSHGAACAFTLAAFARLNWRDDALALRLERLQAALGIPQTLAEAGVPRAELPALAFACTQPRNAQNNPVPLDEATILTLLEGLA
ncbi:MAG: iron-containing alcohol dehydrogenase [Oscillospiraceae bacterium]|nr:iron-containing alcohol dehydrogenase [Oscillospiraceae bacterium]